MMNLAKALGITTLIALTGCAGSQEYRMTSDLDEQTGISLTRPAAPLILAAPRPGLSDIGKDYLLTAPVTVSGLGPSQTYLWFGVGSSVDRKISGAEVPTWQSIILVVDGVAMTFDLVSWEQAAPSTPYESSTTLHGAYAAKVTNSQVQRIVNASRIEAFVTDESNRSPTYLLVNGELQAWAPL